MDETVKKLSEIESAAKKILEHTEQLKKEFEEDIKKRQLAFDQQLEATTTAKLKEMKDSLEEEISTSLVKQTDTSDTALEQLQDDFHKNHTTYAKEILARVIEV